MELGYEGVNAFRIYMYNLAKMNTRAEGVWIVPND